MARFSKFWYAAILKSRNGSSGKSVLESAFPVMPWITHALDPRLLDLVNRVGIVKHLKAGELIFSINQPIDQLVTINKGITARSMGNIDGQAIGLATPGRFAAGNLNFFSSRHAIGRYFAITDCELCFCPHTLLRSVLRTDPDLMYSLSAQFECATLSDRLAFACLSLLGAKDRLKAFTLTWAANYGSLIQTEEGLRIRMPAPMSLQVRSQVANTTPNWIDRILRGWRESGRWVREGDWVTFDPELLQDTYHWMRSLEEANNHYHYPERFVDLTQDKAKSSTTKPLIQAASTLWSRRGVKVPECRTAHKTSS